MTVTAFNLNFQDQLAYQYIYTRVFLSVLLSLISIEKIFQTLQISAKFLKNTLLQLSSQ